MGFLRIRHGQKVDRCPWEILRKIKCGKFWNIFCRCGEGLYGRKYQCVECQKYFHRKCVAEDIRRAYDGEPQIPEDVAIYCQICLM